MVSSLDLVVCYEEELNISVCISIQSCTGILHTFSISCWYMFSTVVRGCDIYAS